MSKFVAFVVYFATLGLVGVFGYYGGMKDQDIYYRAHPIIKYQACPALDYPMGHA